MPESHEAGRLKVARLIARVQKRIEDSERRIEASERLMDQHQPDTRLTGVADLIQRGSAALRKAPCVRRRRTPADTETLGKMPANPGRRSRLGTPKPTLFRRMKSLPPRPAVSSSALTR
jgi:hypothetical protein